jgi:hypothetical protein
VSAGLLFAAATATVDVRAAAALDELGGHLSVGYAKLFVEDAPAGSVSFAGGLDLPLAGPWRAGFELGLSLLGTRNEQRGSLSANIDYSAFEAYACGHWLTARLGPVERVTLGAGLMTARAEISSAGGGAAFFDLSRDELAPALMIQTTLMPHGTSHVKAGIELGARFGFVEQETWMLASAKLAVHY